MTSGVHTVYVRHDNTTRILSGDVYRSSSIVSALNLKTGPIGIVIPLRGEEYSVGGIVLWCSVLYGELTRNLHRVCCPYIAMSKRCISLTPIREREGKKTIYLHYRQQRDYESIRMQCRQNNPLR